MRNIRIVERTSLDNPPKPYFVIQEKVTPQGHYIEWDGAYATKESAEKAVKAETGS